jgi:hypothetical protein
MDAGELKMERVQNIKIETTEKYDEYRKEE